MSQPVGPVLNESQVSLLRKPSFRQVPWLTPKSNRNAVRYGKATGRTMGNASSTFNAIYQGSANSEILHSASRNNLNLYFKFAFLIKSDNLGLLFHVLSFIQFCERKLLLPIVGLVLKFIFKYRVFSTKLYAHKMFGSWEFKTIFLGSLQKVFGGPCNIQIMRATGKNTLEASWHRWRTLWDIVHDTEEKSRA